MARDSERVPTNKIVISDLMRPTTQMPPLFADADDSLVIEEFAPTLSGEHKALVPRDSFELEVIDLRMSGMQPIEDRVSAPTSIELAPDLAEVASTVEKPVRPKTADSTQPLSLSEDEVATMSAIARVNDAVISGALEPIDAAPAYVEPRGVKKIDSSRVTAEIEAQPRSRIDSAPIAGVSRSTPTAELSPIDRVARAEPVPPASQFGATARISTEAAPIRIEDAATDTTIPNRESATSLGVAPLEPATTVRAPFVNDTPVPRKSPLDRPHASTPPPATNLIETAAGSSRLPVTTTGSEQVLRKDRTAMLALDPGSGMPRQGPWQAIVALARSLGSVRWWLRRRRTGRVKPLPPADSQS